jgi:pimeloyl-ACP methyl ester carboxylesterase
MWDEQVALFSEQYRVVRYDLRGFGRSAIPEAGVHYQHQADLSALLDSFGIDRAAVLGLSLGGAVALDFALQHPERVRALVLAASTLPGFATPDLADLSRAIWRAGKTSGAQAARALWLECPLFETVNEQPAASDRVREMVADYSGWGWTDSDPGTWAEPDCAARLDEIAAPTLVLVGERDIAGMRGNAAELANRIPGAEFSELPDVGHLPNMEAPVAFNRVVLDFLDRVYPVPSPA